MNNRLVGCLLALALLAPAAAHGLLLFRCPSGAVRVTCCCPHGNVPAQLEKVFQDAAPRGCSVFAMPSVADEQAPQRSSRTSAAAQVVAAAFLVPANSTPVAFVSKVVNDAPGRRVSLLIAHCSLLI